MNIDKNQNEHGEADAVRQSLRLHKKNVQTCNMYHLIGLHQPNVDCEHYLLDDLFHVGDPLDDD